MTSCGTAPQAGQRARTNQPGAGAVHGVPKLLLRLEGAGALGAAALAYAQVDGPWGLFAALFLLPDGFMLGYLAGPRAGAALYNFGHSYLVPAALCLFGLWSGMAVATQLGLIWIAHVGFDRAVGYGLKYPDAFRLTHLGVPFGRSAGG